MQNWSHCAACLSLVVHEAAASTRDGFSRQGRTSIVHRTSMHGSNNACQKAGAPVSRGGLRPIVRSLYPQPATDIGRPNVNVSSSLGTAARVPPVMGACADISSDVAQLAPAAPTVLPNAAPDARPPSEQPDASLVRTCWLRGVA